MRITPIDQISNESSELNSSLRLFQIYKKLQLTSLKSNSYFQVYEELFQKFIGKKITFVEIGVLHGGSLLMWREYLGDQARIIGVDLDPRAKELEKNGFEIFIGSQSDNNFWKEFYDNVGNVDVVLDDGGHTNDQQIITTVNAINNIKENGLIVIEDTHTSYLKKFGNPSKYSFINYSKYLIDVINSRYPDINIENNFKKKIYSIHFYESLLAININSKKSIKTETIKNDGAQRKNVNDYRTNDYFPKIDKFIKTKMPFLTKIPIIKKIVRYLFYSNNFLIKIKNHSKLKKYFKD
ncbi:MAG: class I SAM-dependent methyltransferase [Pelagibacteraceae bacterium]